MSTIHFREGLHKVEPQVLDSLVLWDRCAEHTHDTALWTELLRRFGPKMRVFIRITLRQSVLSDRWNAESSMVLGGTQESDLFQMTVLRLVQNGCGAMKRFSGCSEEDLVAYLAVITRSVVRDFIREQMASKRPSSSTLEESYMDWAQNSESNRMPGTLDLERKFLAQEVTDLSRRTLDSLQGQFSDRDRLIFELYFFDGLTPTQISRCESIKLTKRGVEDVLNRLKGHVRSAATMGRSEEMTK